MSNFDKIRKDEIIQYIEEHFDEVYKDCMKDCGADEEIFIFQYMIKKFKKEMEEEKRKKIKLKEKLIHDKEMINEKLRIANDINNPLYYKKGFHMNDYQKIRLKGMKTKINEILKFYL